MRLLKFTSHGEFSLTKDLINNIPPYAILSHTWGDDDQEVTFKDLTEGSGKTKVGYRKIQFCGEQATCDGLQHFWVDACCIDKSNSTELSEAINSMFRWYRNAAKCYAYLADVLTNNHHPINQSFQSWEPAFQKSSWFTRGWTLQELLAPPSVEFFSLEGKRLGDKKSLERQIHEITGITIQALQGTSLSEFSVTERLLWAENRETKREEDKAYSLLGIFEIHMPLIYGEGAKNAFGRLRKEIAESPTSAQSECANADQISESIIDSLCFPSMDMREESIKEAHKSTFEWLLTGERTEQPEIQHTVLGEWLRGPDPLLWLSGKAGSGKSTLMKLIFRHPLLLEHLDSWAPAPQRVEAGFFFFDQGPYPLQRSQEGLLRSLLYQVLQKRSELVPKVFPDRWKDYKFKSTAMETQWSWYELQRGFKRLLKLCDGTLQLFFCINGLDEYKRLSESSTDDYAIFDEDEYTIAQRRGDDHQEIAELFSEAARQPGVKMCLSSRPLPIFNHTFRDFPTIQLDKVTARDIALFVENVLGVDDGIRQMQYGGSNLHSILVQEIVGMAAGVFLWVRLVVNKVLAGVRDGDCPSELMATLKSLPRELSGRKGLYMRMLEDISIEHRQQAAKMFRLIQCARVPLSPLLLSFADEDMSAAIGSWTVGSLTGENIKYRRMQAAKRLTSRCAGLLELVESPDSLSSARQHPSSLPWSPQQSLTSSSSDASSTSGEPPSPTIRFIHKTAKDMLASKSGWTQLFPDQGGQHSQFDINTSFIVMYLLFIKTARGTPGEIDTIGALFEAIYFANRAEKSTGIAQVDLLDDLDRSMSAIWRTEPHYQALRDRQKDGILSWHWLMGENRSPWSSDWPWQDDFMSVAVQGQLTLYLKAKLSSGAYNLAAKKGRPLLCYAVFPIQAERKICVGDEKQADPATTEVLLNYGADPNQVFAKRSPWQLHLQWAFNSKVIKRNFVWARYADGIKWAENAKLLIKHGADPNVWLWIRVRKWTNRTYSPLFVTIDVLRGNSTLRREVVLLLKQYGGYLYRGEREKIRSEHFLDEPVQRAYAKCYVTLNDWDELNSEEIRSPDRVPLLSRQMAFKNKDEMKRYLQDLESLLAELGEEGDMTVSPY